MGRASRAASIGEGHGWRFLVAFCVSVAVCAALAWGVVGRLPGVPQPPPVPAVPPLDVQLVSLAPLAPPAAAVHAAPAVAPPSAPPSASPGTPPHVQHPAPVRPVHQAHVPVPAATPPPEHPKAGPGTNVPEPAPQQPAATAAPAAPPAAIAGPAASSPAGASRSTAPSTGNAAALALAQPLPEVPDDLREIGLTAVALVRLTIHVDGTVEVRLVQATPEPRLNQRVLLALRSWRFKPAQRDGQAIESEQDVRVHFNVH